MGMLEGLEGKVALVTGGASGIGRATARRLHAAGAGVVVFDLPGSEGKQVADELAGSFVAGDVAVPADWERLTAAVRADHGGLDIAHLNAGVVTSTAAIAELSPEQYEHVRRVNLDGVVLGLHTVVPLIGARGGGAIVATASLAGLIGFSPDPIYGATKAAVVALVRALAPQLEPMGITINAICPGMVDTPMASPEVREALAAANFPLIDPEDIAEAVYQRVIGTDTGRAWICQAGREPIAYKPAGVPGPGGDNAGRTPPAGIAAADQLRP